MIGLIYRPTFKRETMDRITDDGNRPMSMEIGLYRQAVAQILAQ